MKEALKAMTVFVLVNAVIYPFGVILAATLLLFWQLGYIRISHWERFPHFKEGVIVVANHPSMMDPFLIAALFFRGYLINPLRYGPLIVVDKKNFWDKPCWRWLSPFFIPVDRGNPEGEKAWFRLIRAALEKGRTVVIFPEAGRTDFGPDENGFVYSKTGNKKRIRKLKDGVGLLALLTQATVVPIWVEGTKKFLPNDKKNRKILFTKFRFSRGAFIRVNIGKPLSFSEEKDKFQKNKKERKAIVKAVTDKIADSIVELAV